MNSLDKQYNKYLTYATGLYLSHNKEVSNAELPSHWKPSLMLDLGEILTKTKFNIRIKGTDEFAQKWKLQ